MKKSTYNVAYDFRKRLFILTIALMLFLSYLLFNLFKLQVSSHEYYKNKVYDQITTTSPLKAARGKIYDSDMNVLATTKTVWRVFVSTRDIRKNEREDGIKYSEIIARGASEILELNYDTVLKKIQNSSILDVTLKNSINENKYATLLEFVRKNNLENMVFFEAQTSRHYPENTLAAHVLGFCGSDNQGLYGLEYYYDDILKGTDGYYLYAKDANGNALDIDYSDFTPAQDGNSIVTTIDSFVQSALENEIDKILREQAVENRVCGIVMDTDTGAILAMATSSPFNPNNPYDLDEISSIKLSNSGYNQDSEEYKKYKTELMQIMWSNKAVSETYEPGSTFKIITVCAALDTRAADINDTFSCNGYHAVGGWRIKCHKVGGHGSGFNLAYGLQMSCNPTMMQIAERMGASNFYEYIQKFGYLKKTGIDLPSEANTIFHRPENIGSTELATMSFGQRFKVSIISQLCAVNAVANGGKWVKPYLVDKIVDSDGKVISQHETEYGEQVVSEEVARLVSDVLEKGVSGDGGAKNAAVDGYLIAAKTGTSEKFDVLDANGNSYLRIGSTVAYAPSNTGGVTVIIVVDEPTQSVKYGSVVAAPYVSSLLNTILPYLSYESSENSDELKVESYVGMSVSDVSKKLSLEKINYEIIGNGNTVISQTPIKDEVISLENGKIYIYTVKGQNNTEVPSLVGLPLHEAVRIAINSGLNVEISGAGSGVVLSQSIPYGASVPIGEIIKIDSLILDYED